MRAIVIIAAALLVLTIPAHAGPNAGGSHAEWRCGKNAFAASGKGEISFTIGFGGDYGRIAYPTRGSRRPHWRWDYSTREPKIWLNGKLCKPTQ